MRKLISLALVALFIAPQLFSQKTYSYTTVPNDPIGVRHYVLDNGLTVYLSRNDDAPRIQTNIAVRAGSKMDPADATGLAHYLEHMLFKGTSRIGTQDWEKESALLDRISEHYEQRRGVTDEAERERLYAAIDSLSFLAAQVAIPNEYDKMISSTGARGTNAYTSVEQTVYVNDIPSEEMKKWMLVERERFQELVLRLFHTELETVYEEFNRAQDNDYRSVGEAMMSTLFAKHPYGTQTTLGSGEHLKNPSMVKIHRYFETWYVPNNIAIIMAGDLEFDRTIAMIDEHFGTWQAKDVPHFTFEPEEPIVLEEVREVFGPMAAWVDIGWRHGGAGTEDELMGDLIAGLLSNGQAGLIDLGLLKDQKVLQAYAFSFAMEDYGMFQVHGEPKQGQTIEEVRELLLQQIASIQRGEFDDWLIEAVVNDLRQSRIRSWSDSNGARARALTNAFTRHQEWGAIVDQLDRMAGITKQQVMDFAKRRLNKGHVTVFKRTGEKKDIHKVPKPKITAVDIERGMQSDWRKDWDKVPSAEVAPVFIDYKSAIHRGTLKSGIAFAHVPNLSNDLFGLYYILDMGTENDRALGLAVEYLPYLGTTKYSPAELNKELFKLGLSMGVDAGDDRVYVSLSGLERNMERGIELLEHLLADAQVNDEALAELINDIGKERQDRTKNKGFLLNQAMLSYARYGAHSPLTDALSLDEMRAIPGQALVDRIRQLTSHEHRIFHYGRTAAKETMTLLNKAHMVPALRKVIPEARDYPELPTTENKVYFLDHDMVQTELVMMSKAGSFDLGVLPYASLFNEYFGSGLSSIVFQEIREAKALAYSARAYFTSPSRADEAHYVRAAIGTQTDKLGDAVEALLVLMNEMPEADEQFADAKASAMKVIASDRVTRQRIYWSWEANQRLGLDRDLRKDQYEAIPGITMSDMKTFFDREIKGRNYTYLVIGKGSAMDFDALERLGEVRKLSKKEVLGYDEEH